MKKKKILVVSIYDAACWWSVCINGRVYNANNVPTTSKYKALFKHVIRYDDYEGAMAKLLPEFDIAILVEDGDIRVMKHDA